MNNPVFGTGRMKLNPKTIEAAKKAMAAPCAVCAGKTVTARELVPHFPEAFSIPAEVALFVPLCPEHQNIEQEIKDSLAARKTGAPELLWLQMYTKYHSLPKPLHIPRQLLSRTANQ